MTNLDFQSAQLELLTDALRAGPGTPLWREALAGLAAAPGADEYALLYAARERLASGREYREVRAGAGFTRRLFDVIDAEQSSARWPLPSANLIAGASALVILGILVVVAFIVIPRADQAQDLSQTYFVNTRAQTDFSSGLGADWTAFGPLAVRATKGLSPVPSERSPGGFVGGGAIYARELAPNEAFAVEASVLLNRASDDVVVQLFVTDTPTFSADRATSPNELVWSVRGSQASVVRPGGAVEPANLKLRDGRSIEVRMVLNRADATVEMNGQKLWSGPHELDASRPRTLGIRFLTAGPVDEKSLPVVESVRILVPQAK